MFGQEIEAVIFDLDGTLLDSSNLWKEIDHRFFTKRNCEVPQNYSDEIAHIGLIDAAKLTKEKYFPNEKVEDILQEWNKESMEFYHHKIKTKPYVKEFLQYLKEKKIKLGIATANSSHLYLPCLQRNEILQAFDYIADVEQVKCNKQSSKLYDDVANHLNASKEKTIVFEDLALALKTAKESGYLCVGIFDENSHVDEDTKKKYCDLFIDSFKEMMDD